MQAFKKVINPGTTARGNVFIEILWDGKRLSLHGVIGPLKSGNCRGSCGQIQDSIADEIAEHNADIQKSAYAQGWDYSGVIRLVELWKRWHLNDMKAGCEHQRALGWTYAEHPSEPCPECGYKYGSAWLHEAVPEDALQELAALPDSKITPAWV